MISASSHPFTSTLRNILQKFFFPNDYTERPASCTPQPGEKRIYTSMDVSVRLTSRAAFNIPFHDDKGVRMSPDILDLPQLTSLPTLTFLTTFSPPPFLPPSFLSTCLCFTDTAPDWPLPRRRFRGHGAPAMDHKPRWLYIHCDGHSAQHCGDL